MSRTSIYCAAILLTAFLFITSTETPSVANGWANPVAFGQPRFVSSPGVMLATPPLDAPGEDDGQGDLESLKEELQKLKDFLESIPESEAAKKFKKALERLGNEIEILEKSFRNTIEKEILPWLKKEIERLKKELRRYFEEPDDNQPRKVKLLTTENAHRESFASCLCA